MALAAFLLLFASSPWALWRDPGPPERMDLARGPSAQPPKGPFTFVKEITTGITPKVVVRDAAGAQWMVKFGEEVKPEVFSTRIAWAAGYAIRPSFFVEKSVISGAGSLKKAQQFIEADGTAAPARFQAFDTDRLHERERGRLDWNDRSLDRKELNGLKLLALLLANWDVKPQNTPILVVDGKEYATISDWGATLGDPGAADAKRRKWNCEAYRNVTPGLIENVADGYITFNYRQYAARNERELSEGIRQTDMQWFTNRMSRITDAQLRAALKASGATPEETDCFAAAIRDRLNAFKAAGEGRFTGGTTTTIKRTIRTTTTTTRE